MNCPAAKNPRMTKNTPGPAPVRLLCDGWVVVVVRMVSVVVVLRGPSPLAGRPHQPQGTRIICYRQDLPFVNQ